MPSESIAAATGPPRNGAASQPNLSYLRPKLLTVRPVSGRCYKSWFGARPPATPVGNPARDTTGPK